MVYLRSALFQVTFYLAFIVQMIIFTPFYFLLPRKAAYHIAKFWCRGNLFMADKIAGISYEIQGLENLPKGGFIAGKEDGFGIFEASPTPSKPKVCCTFGLSASSEPSWNGSGFLRSWKRR